MKRTVWVRKCTFPEASNCLLFYFPVQRAYNPYASTYTVKDRLYIQTELRLAQGMSDKKKKKKKTFIPKWYFNKKTKLAVCVSEDDAALTGFLLFFFFSFLYILLDGNCYYSYLFCKLNQRFAISIIRFYIVKEANHAQKSWKNIFIFFEVVTTHLTWLLCELSVSITAWVLLLSSDSVSF